MGAEAKASKAKAELQVVAATIINVETNNDTNKKINKGLVKRLTMKKKITVEELKAEKAAVSVARDAVIKAKVKKAAVESKKVKMAQLRASSDKSKADKAKAEVQAVTATIINIDTGKNPNKKAKKVLLKRLSGTKKSSQEDMRTGREKASVARDATIKAKVDKAAEESIKV